jgi:protein-arginine kinase activator protein McsA
MVATSKKVSLCEYCHIGLKGERELEEHLSKGDGHSFKCRVKQSMEMVRTAKRGERKLVCKMCGKGFKTFAFLKVHNSVYSTVQYICV